MPVETYLICVGKSAAERPGTAAERPGTAAERPGTAAERPTRDRSHRLSPGPSNPAA